MGQYYVKGSGWRFQYKLKAKRRQSKFFKTKKAAAEAEATDRKDLEKRLQTEETTCTTFGTLLIKRLNHVKLHNSEDYYEAYRFMAARWLARWEESIKAKWEDIPCEEITGNMIKDFIDERAEKKSKHAANKDLRYLKAVFGWGMQLDPPLVNKNPTAKIPMFSMEEKKKYIPPKNDVWAIMLSANQDVQDYLWSIILTLARCREINRLTWDDVNFDKRYVILYTRKKRGGNLRGRRIHMLDKLYDILWRRYEGRDKDKSWVFWHTYWSNKTGEKKEGPYKYRRRILGTLCKKLGIKDFRFHNLRHFGASTLLDLGFSKADIQEILGHEKLSTTDIYIQSLKPSTKDALEGFEKELFEKNEDEDIYKKQDEFN